MSSEGEVDGDGGDERREEGGGYVHDPSQLDGAEPAAPATDREFDWRGWVLVGVLVVALIVAPALVLLRPPALPFEVAFLVLPLVPALLLGAVAVWATTRP